MMLKREEPVSRPATSSDNTHIDTLIGVHSSFTGELAFEGAVRIDGRFDGNIKSSKDGTLIVSQGAEISGEVQVPNLILYGVIKGNVHTSKGVKVGKTGCINGDVEYRVITLAEGATINGRCTRISDKAPATAPSAPPAKEAKPATA